MSAFAFLLLVGLVATAITVLAAAGARYCFKSDLIGVIIGGIAIPALFLLGLVYWLASMEVDDAPPGMVIMGSLQAVGIATPLTFLISFLTVRTAARRSLSRTAESQTLRQ